MFSKKILNKLKKTLDIKQNRLPIEPALTRVATRHIPCPYYETTTTGADHVGTKSGSVLE